MSAPSRISDKKLLWAVVGIMAVLILLLALFAPSQLPDDPNPTTTNNGPNGAKAAFLVLQQLGRNTSRWTQPLSDLNGSLDDDHVARTTLVLAAPALDLRELKRLQAELKRFLERGGRVLSTGPSGAMLLPGGELKKSGILRNPECRTIPEGPGPLARVGSIRMDGQNLWGNEAPNIEVAQRCNGGAVVVSYAVGRGRAIWWSSAAPLENAQLKQDTSLALLLASLGDNRDILFDESLRGAPPSFWSEAKGLPLAWLALQAALLFALLLFSFSRTRGPLRAPLALPRSSPAEFAESMGDLYEKAGATSAATDAARRRLLRVLAHEAGISQQSLQQGPDAIAEALQSRLGGEWAGLRDHLAQSQEVQHSRTTPRSALALVRALSADAEAVRSRLKPPPIAVQ